VNVSPTWAVDTPATLSFDSAGGTYNFSVKAIDPQPWDTLYYSILGVTPLGYSINSSSGILTVLNGSPNATITIRVSDSEFAYADHICSVAVAVVNPGTSDTPDYIDPVANITRIQRTTVNVSTVAQLNAAIAAATIGTTIQLAAGTYAGAVTVNKDFPAADALIIKGATNFASIATGAWTVTGARQIITGIDFSATTARINLRGTNNHIVGNKFRNWTTAGVIALGNNNTDTRSYNEVAYNEIGPPGSPAGVTYRWGIKGSSGTSESSVAKHAWIHHNWFRDYNSGYQGADTRGDAMEVGESGIVSYANTLVAGWYIEDNVVTNAQLAGESLFDVKYGGCVIRRNTVDVASSDCKIQARMGRNSILESNYMASGVVQVYGKGHKIVGNHGALRVNAGEDSWDVLSNLHHQSVDTLVAKNTGSLTVGYQANAAYTFPALTTTIEEHSGTITLDADGQTGTIDNRSSPSSYGCVPAVQKTSADVGPSAIATVASAAYKAARGLAEPLPISNYDGGPAWPSGIGQASAQIDAWETWVGRSPGTMDVVTAFSSSTPLNWTSYRDGKAGAGSNFTIALSKEPRTRTIIHVYPMFAKFNNTLAAGDNSGTNLSNENNARPQTFAEIAAGDYDIHYTACATAMRQLIINSGRDINDNNGNVIINLAHEMNGDWYDHFVGSATANWVLAWRRIVTRFREVMPGLRFEWRPARNDRTAAYNGGVRTNPAAYFPGSSYVDFVGRSLHDNYASVDGTSHSTIDENSWQKIHVVPTDKVWAVGLTEMLAIATTNGKKFGLSEWGAQMTAISGHAVGEASSVFIQKCYEWMYANRANLAWDTYFSSSDASLHGTSPTVDPESGGATVARNNTKAALKFKSLWGLDAPIVISYTPGHYAAYEATRTGVNSTFSNANHPGIVGVQMRYMWKNLETSLGVYDFSQVLTDLDNARAVGKKVVVMIVDKTFSDNVSGAADYRDGAVPSYLLPYTSPNPGGSAGALSVHRWRDYPRDRLIALIQALAGAINGHAALEAVATQETSIGISDANLTTYGYTHQLYRDAYKSVLSAACTAFPTKRIFWYMNFIASTPDSGGGGQAMIGDVIDYMIASNYRNFSFGGPDILPNSTSLNNLTYPYYDTYNGQVRMFCSNQFDSYESIKSTSPTVYHTMDEMLDWGVTNLHINYCMWNYQATADPVGSNDWADALVAIAASPTFGPT